MRKSFITLILVVTFSSCSNQPKCDDKTIKNEVIRMCAEKFLGANGSRFYREWVFDRIEANETRQDAEWRLAEEYQIYYSTLLDSIKLIGVRMASSDSETKQCSCLAEIQFHDKSKMAIEYSAQNTEDKDNPIYLEIKY